MPRILLLLALAALLVAPVATAQSSYPAQPIRLIVPFPPGGGTDGVSRAIAARVEANTRWHFVVENRPGAGGNIGLEALARARPDGLTLGMGQTANLAINPALYPKMPYDPLRDFVPVGLIAAQPVVIVVRADAAQRRLADLVAAAKVKPATLSMASSGNGSVGHLAGEMFSKQAGVRLVHVPYKGAAPALTDLLGGQTTLLLTVPQTAVPMIRAGRLRALAVTSAQRLAVLPDVPTIAEQGYPGFEANDWKVLLAPAGTPRDIIARLAVELDKVLSHPETLAMLAADGSTALGGTPGQAEAFLRAEHARWGAAVRESGATLD